MNKKKALKRLNKYSSFFDINYNFSKNTGVCIYVDHDYNINFNYESTISKNLYSDIDKYGIFWISNKKYVTKINKIKIKYIKELYIMTILFKKPIKL
jgi:hypothetical protein